MLRPPTRVAQFLEPSQGNDNVQSMCKIFGQLHRDLDIPQGIINDAFGEALDESDWDHIASKKGNTMACCRPALNRADVALYAEHLHEEPLTFLQKACHKKDVKPVSAPKDDGEYRWSSHRAWALYPGGACNNELWALPLPAIGDQRASFPSLRYRRGSADFVQDASAQPSIEFARTIRQLVTREEHPGVACVRTDNMVSLLGLTQRHQPPSWTPCVEAEIVGSPYLYDQGDVWTGHVSWSPWTMSEMALASGTGCVRLWDCSASRETVLKQCDDQSAYDNQWNCCEYWNSPRHFLCANPDMLYMLDSRVGCLRANIISLADSPFAAADELFTAVCPSALHPMHALAASTHYIRVFDQRYPTMPVVAWRHNLSTHDPPIFLQTSLISHYEAGRAAVVLAASEQSSLVASYVYGQHGSDQPYVSIEQAMLASSTGTSRVGETIQDMLAVDLKESQDMTLGHTYVSSRLTARLSGLALHLLPCEPGTDGSKGRGNAGSAKGPKPALASADAVCLSVDESGAVVGRHLLLIPRSYRKIGGKPGRLKSAYNTAFKAPIWTDFCISQGALVDGLGSTLFDKASNDRRREMFWAELRKRGIAYRRKDLRAVYQFLAGTVSSAPTAQPEACSQEEWRCRLSGQLDSGVRAASTTSMSCFDLANRAIGTLSSAPLLSMKSELPTWTAKGERVRDAFLSMLNGDYDSDSVVGRVVGSAGNSDMTDATDEAAERSGRNCKELGQLFSVTDAHKDSHTAAALARAAKDIELARLTVHFAHSERRASQITASDGLANMSADIRFASAELDMLPKLESLAGAWSKAARLVDGRWRGPSQPWSSQYQPNTLQARQSQQMYSRKRRTGLSQTAVGASNSSQHVPVAKEWLVSQPLSSLARIASATQSSILAEDAFALASQRPSQPARMLQQPSQAKRKPTRKSGF
ncbi:TATA box-binding protein-associated factor RNA polymerase I subunit C [Coemansia thaxteri]|nr:TATA box-binding protein-associated factor RNA polymerase I subunit C [Coemansia thaxteri]